MQFMNIFYYYFNFKLLLSYVYAVAPLFIILHTWGSDLFFRYTDFIIYWRTLIFFVLIAQMFCTCSCEYVLVLK